jgi:glucose/mannose transport system substrate-binding protein
MGRARRVLLAVVVAGSVSILPACSKATDRGDREVEVFSWWVGPGDREGLDALVGVFRQHNPDVRFINASVEGGAGVNAKSVLATRLQTNDPPDSYQVHAGLELASDIRTGKVEDLTYLYDREGWRDKFPRWLLDSITVDGRIYSVPVNIHRSNLLWYNPKVLRAVGVAAPPTTWSQLLEQAPRFRAAGITPLSVGPLWTLKHLLENVLLGELGPDRYSGLWTGATDWHAPEVLAALTTYTKVLAVSDMNAASSDWQPALDRMASGAAAYNVMGDWADSYLGRAKHLAFHIDYDAVATPGSDGILNLLSDTFTMSAGAPHRAAAEKWLTVCGSVEAENAFNPQKGSVPARLDADRSRYRDYLASALAEWSRPGIRVVGSLTHGMVASNAWNGEIDNALGVFSQDLDTKRFADAVARSYTANQ